MSASRYVGILGVVANFHSTRSPLEVFDSTGLFETAAQ